MIEANFGHEARRLRVGTLVRLRWIAVAARSRRCWWRLCAGHRLPDSAGRALRGGAARLQPVPAAALLSRQEAGGESDDADPRLRHRPAGADAVPDRRPRQPVRGAADRADDDLGGVAILAGDRQAARLRDAVGLRAGGLAHAAALADGAVVAPPFIETIGELVAIVVSAIFVAIYGGQVAKEGAPTRRRARGHRADPRPRPASLAARRARRRRRARTRHAARDADGRRSRDRQPAGGRGAVRRGSRTRQAGAGALPQRSSASSRSPTASAPSRSSESRSRRCWRRSPAPHRLQDIDIEVTARGAEPQPTCPRNPALLYGLGNLVENAVAYADRACVSRRVDKEQVEIAIATTGRGFRRRCCSVWASPISPTAAPPAAPTRRRAWGSGSSSPRRCWSATGAELRSAISRRRQRRARVGGLAAPAVRPEPAPPAGAAVSVSTP